MFVDYEYYQNQYGGSELTEDEANIYLKKSERQINILCRNRINDNSVLNYSSSSQEVVKQVICDHAEYLFEKKEEIYNGTIRTYQNNGVSVTYSSNTAVTTFYGVTIKSDLYEELSLTGICYSGL